MLFDFSLCGRFPEWQDMKGEVGSAQVTQNGSHT